MNRNPGSYRLLLCLTCVGAAGCSSSSSSWQLVTGEGLPLTGFHAEATLFINDSTGLVLGSILPDAGGLGSDFRAGQVATLFRTTDGGRNWQKTTGDSGSRFVLTTKAGPVVFAVQLQESDAQRDSSRLLRSVDQGRSWQPIGVLPHQITSLSFADSTQGFALTNHEEQGLRLIYHTTDGGRHWQRAALPLSGSASWGLHTPDGTSWLLLTSPGSPYYSRHLAKINWATSAATVEVIPQGRVDKAVASDAAGNLWLASDDPAGTIQLLRRDHQTGRYSRIHSFGLSQGQPLLAEALHVSGRSITLLASYSDTTVALNTYHAYHSTDTGRSWQEEELPIASNVSSAAFTGPEKAWLFAGGNTFQVRYPTRK
ncbi:hypothetical protein HER32_20060 [Hymenobacter sp. BT18]|uniref:WD40/YVTN/BNR-like repeat-containing protein n=1 Tax=Hymenobacter sp. BT18 TaxID=2835648 RepID=UPI00143EDBE8|nr:YCF48-related protein [Hymenobacter sp. BT18]QIX63343.1 hypothetical protein HER32_20060 [Hymenobacter sp. BT18]